MVRRLVRTLLWAGLLMAHAAIAGGIAFDLSLTGRALSIVQRGDSTAYYPQAFRIGADGQWIKLAATDAQAELRPGATARFDWNDETPAGNQTALERTQPVMIRFFDQAGVYFGQISFFRGPPPATAPVAARYADGALEIRRPAGSPIIATWILAAREEGIAPIRRAVSFDHAQPAAPRIDWSRTDTTARVDAGAGLPAAILVHETPAGLTQQVVANGGLQGREQRTGWLNAGPSLWIAAQAAGAAGLALLLFGWAGRWRRKDG